MQKPGAQNRRGRMNITTAQDSGRTRFHTGLCPVLCGKALPFRLICPNFLLIRAAAKALPSAARMRFMRKGRLRKGAAFPQSKRRSRKSAANRADRNLDPSACNISAPFIRRPVATTLLTVAIALAGAVAYEVLPVAPLPEVDFPTISVSAGLPGATAGRLWRRRRAFFRIRRTGGALRSLRAHGEGTTRYEVLHTGMNSRWTRCRRRCC